MGHIKDSHYENLFCYFYFDTDNLFIKHYNQIQFFLCFLCLSTTARGDPPHLKGLIKIESSDRSCRPDVFYKEDFSENFDKLTRKHADSPFQNFVGLKPATVLKKRLWHKRFRVNFPKFSRTSSFIEQLFWLFLVWSHQRQN